MSWFDDIIGGFSDIFGGGADAGADIGGSIGAGMDVGGGISAGLGDLASSGWGSLEDILGLAGKVAPYAFMGMSALNKPKQPKLSFAQAPITGYSKEMLDRIMGMANEGFNAPQTWNKVLNRLQELNVARGLVPDASSGAFQRTLSDAMVAKAEEGWNKTQSLYQTAGSLLGQYPNQPVVSQPVPSTWNRLAKSYLDLVMSQNQAKAINPQSIWSWGI